MILDRLLDPWSESSHTAFHVTQRQLSTLSLVCQHWSGRLRPTLFGRRLIRTSADVQFLLDVMQSPLSDDLAGHIVHVECEHQSTDPMPLFWKSLVRHLESVRSFSISCRLGDKDEDSPPLFSFVLRPCPTSLTQLTQLKLRRCRFASFSALFRTVGNLPCLRDIELHRVLWRKKCELIRPPSCTAAFRFVRFLRIDHCTQHWPFAYIFAAAITRHGYSWKLGVDEEVPIDISTIVQIIQALPQPFPGDDSGIIFKRRSHRDGSGMYSAVCLCCH